MLKPRVFAATPIVYQGGRTEHILMFGPRGRVGWRGGRGRGTFLGFLTFLGADTHRMETYARSLTSFKNRRAGYFRVALGLKWSK